MLAVWEGSSSPSAARIERLLGSSKNATTTAFEAFNLVIMAQAVKLIPCVSSGLDWVPTLFYSARESRAGRSRARVVVSFALARAAL